MKTKLNALNSIKKSAESTLKELKTRYTELRCYLVYSSNLGQAPLKSPLEVLDEFPQFVEPSPVLEKYLELKKRLARARKLNQPTEIEKANSEIEKIQTELLDLEIRDNVFVELRFEQLNFELIGKLKTDPLLANPYNEMEARSIRIVLTRVNDTYPVEG